MTKLSRTALDTIEVDVGFAAALAVVLARPFGTGSSADAQMGIASIAAMVVAMSGAALLLERRLPRWRRTGEVERNWAVFVGGAVVGLVVGFVALVIVVSVAGPGAPPYFMAIFPLGVAFNVWIPLGAVRPVPTQPGR